MAGRDRTGQDSIAGHFQLQIANHLEVLAILGRKREPFLEGGRGDQGVERLQSMRARVGLHEVVRPASDVLVRRDRAVSAQYKIEIGGFALRAGAGKEFEAGDRGDGPRTGEAVEVVRRCYASPLLVQ